MDENERSEVIRRSFAVITAMAEDTAGLASDGQSVDAEERAMDLSASVGEKSRQITAIADAAHFVSKLSE